MYSDTASHPGAPVRPEDEHERQEDETRHGQSDRDRTGRPVCARRNELRRRRRGGHPERGGDLGPAQSRARARNRCLHMDVVARARGGDVLDAPRVPQRSRDRGVHVRKRAARVCPVVGSAGVLGELLQRRGRVVLARDPDGVDEHVVIARDSGCGRQRMGAQRISPVREEDEHAGSTLRGKDLDRVPDRVVERSPLSAVNRKTLQGGIRIASVLREARNCDHVRAEGHDRHAVASRLGRHELARGRDGVRELRAPHRPRAVDREYDGLRVCEVDGLESGDVNAVLGEGRVETGARGRDHGRADGRVLARVETGQAHAGRRCNGQRQHGEREPDEDDLDNRAAAGVSHENAPWNFEAL